MIKTNTATLFLLVVAVNLNFPYIESKVDLVGRRVLGAKRLKFKCKFKTKEDKNVIWTLNDKNIEGYPEFSVTHKYKKEKKKVVSVMEILHPKVLYGDCYVTCQMNRIVHKFPYFYGMSYQRQGVFYYSYDREAKKPKYSIENFKKYCENWNMPVRGCVQSIGCSCTFVGFKPMDTTSMLPIKPYPFISFSIFNNMTLPSDVRYNLDITGYYDWLSLENITTSNFIIDKSLKKTIKDIGSPWNTYMEIRPNTVYDATVRFISPFWSRFYSINYDLKVTSSSLKPNVPSILNSTRTNEWCELFVQFPSNVDVSDTYEHFIPQFTVDDRIENEVLRITDEKFKVKVYSGNQTIRMRILSTAEKYNGDLSKAVRCN